MVAVSEGGWPEWDSSTHHLPNLVVKESDVLGLIHDVVKRAVWAQAKDGGDPAARFVFYGFISNDRLKIEVAQ